MIDTIEAQAAGAPPQVKPSRRANPAVPDPARVDRLPPHSLEAEQGVLGCVLLAPKEGLGQCIAKFKRGAEVFYDLRHQTLFHVLVEMYDRAEPIDLVTLSQRLKDKNLLETTGGYAYLSGLLDAVPSAAHLEYYIEIVREKHVLRKMIQTCTGVVARVYEEQDNVEQLLDEVERDVLRISEERHEEAALTVKELVKNAISTIEDFHQRQGQLTGLGTGFPDLDKMTSGLHGGEMIVIAARPSMGKTSLAMNIAETVAVEQKLPVGVFSLEMTSASLVLRMLCSRARVNLRSVREGFLAERDFPKLTGAAGRLAGAPLFIDDTPGLSILQLRARARRMWQQFDIKLFVIDYMQLLHSTARRADQNRQQEIADISSGVKALAKELNVPVVVLSQLNREVERDKSRKPRLSDLRESGAIEQDADLVGLLYKADPENPKRAAGGDEDDDGTEADAVPVNLLIAKQRNGPTGDVQLTFLRSYTRFESASKISADDIPLDN
jgi:replicative DNA helicase